MVCIQYHNVPAITFKYSDLMNFAETASSGSTSKKCGENGATKKNWTYMVFDATKIEYRNEQIYTARNMVINKPARK